MTGSTNTAGILSAVSPIAGAAIDAIGSVAGGLFSANQAKKNRAFQERMYNKQLEDNRENWRIQMEYADPKNELARIKNAGLNPLLMYGQGGLMSTVATPQGGSLPSGSHASGSFQTSFGQAMYQAAMIQAQINNLNANTAKTEAEKTKTEAETNWQNIETKFAVDTYDVRRAIATGNLRLVSASVDKMYNEMVNNNIATIQQMLTMTQARIYEIKRYDLDASIRGEQLLQGWDELKQGWQGLKLKGQEVAQGWKSLAIQAGHLVNETKMTNAQVGMLQWNLLQDKAMFGLRFEGLSLDNKLKRWDTHLRKATLTEKQVNIWNGVLKNYYLQNTGTEQITNMMTQFPQSLWQATNKPSLQDLFVIPKMKK